MTRFRNPGQLWSWAGLTPQYRESDARVTRGRVTKQGPRLLRWALIEGIQRAGSDTVGAAVKAGVIARRSRETRDIAKSPPPAGSSP